MKAKTAFNNPFPVKVFLLAAVISGLSASLAVAQSASRIDKILNTDAVSLEQSAWIMLGAAGRLPENASVARAYLEMQRLAPHYRNHPGTSPANARDLSLMGIKAFEVPGSLFLSIFGHPRYAFRTARYRRILLEIPNPDHPMSGLQTLELANRFTEYVERGRPARM